MSLLADEGFLSQSRKNGKIDRWMDIFDKIRVIFGERKDKSKKAWEAVIEAILTT